jgi:hypothetical protein
VRGSSAAVGPTWGNHLEQLFEARRELMTPPDPPERPIGFVTPEDKGGSKESSGAKGKT